MLKFSKKEKEIGEKIHRKFLELKAKNEKAPLISFKDLFKMLDKGEQALIKKIISVNPKDYGKKAVFYGIKPVPKNAVAISGQKYFSMREHKVKKINTQFLPKSVFLAFKRMNEAMKKDIGLMMNVASGYRSPAYQAIVFFNNLVENKWSMARTLKWVFLPGFSEHGNPKRQAVDFGSVKGTKRSSEFEKTPEFEWLFKNAKRLGFILLYPKNNKLGIGFEPWHWHFETSR